MPDYKVKITPELDSGKFQKELKNLTRDRTMKIKLDSSGLEKAARLAEKLNTKLTSASGPKAPNLSNYSQAAKDINALVDAQNRLQSAIVHTGNISPPAISGPSEADLNRMREASKAYEELYSSIQKYNEISSAVSTDSGKGSIPSSQMQTDASKNANSSQSILDKGITALNTLSAVTSIGNGLPTLLKNINSKLTSNLDQPKFLAATLP